MFCSFLNPKSSTAGWNLLWRANVNDFIRVAASIVSLLFALGLLALLDALDTWSWVSRIEPRFLTIWLRTRACTCFVSSSNFRRSSSESWLKSSDIWLPKLLNLVTIRWRDYLPMLIISWLGPFKCIIILDLLDCTATDLRDLILVFRLVSAIFDESSWLTSICF